MLAARPTQIVTNLRFDVLGRMGVEDRSDRRWTEPPGRLNVSGRNRLAAVNRNPGIQHLGHQACLAIRR